MSRSKNKHHASWNYSKRQAKYYSNKNRRNYGKQLIRNMDKVDPEDDERAITADKNAGKGNIWIYD